MITLIDCLIELLRQSMAHPTWRLTFVSLAEGGHEQAAHFYADQIDLLPGDVLSGAYVTRQCGPLTVRLFGRVRIYEVAHVGA